MTSTKESVDALIEDVDGSSVSKDVSLKKRWRKSHQTAADLIWNDRFWQFKVKDAALPFAADPSTKNWLPDDWGSFEALVDAGVFTPVAAVNRPIDPCHKSEMVRLKNVEKGRVGDPVVWCVSYSDADDGKAYLDLHPIFAVDTTLSITYLMKSPTLQYVETDGGLPNVDSGVDEIGRFPEQWRRLISLGAEWIQCIKTGNALAENAKNIFHAGLDEMRAREACIVRTLEPWRPGRLGQRI